MGSKYHPKFSSWKIELVFPYLTFPKNNQLLAGESELMDANGMFHPGFELSLKYVYCQYLEWHSQKFVVGKGTH